MTYRAQADPYAYKIEPVPSKVVILPESRPNDLPLQNAVSLESAVFDTNANSSNDPCDSISVQASVEQKQIRLLLDQIAARHHISNTIHEQLLYRECQLTPRLHDNPENFSGGMGGLQLQSDLERKLSDLHKERNMESVSLWRDTQKALTELFRHWTAYQNLKRREQVLDLDL